MWLPSEQDLVIMIQCIMEIGGVMVLTLSIGFWEKRGGWEWFVFVLGYFS